MAPLPPDPPDRTSPRIAILGNDVLLAAAPATAVQLAHACMAMGYDLVVPESWGDELIATETLRQLERRTGEPAILCTCPFVASRLLATGGDLAPFLISLVAPPIAAARYLRSMFAEHTLRLTYVGACPAGADPSIDAHIEPDAFLRRIADQGVVLEQQPTVFDSVVPPDRRRWNSLPGGTPAPGAVDRTEPGRTLFEVLAEDISTEIAQLLIAQDIALVDLSTRLGCACAARRDAIAALEPPRSTGPVVEPAVPIALSRPLSAPTRGEPDASDASTTDDAGAFEFTYADEDDTAPSSPALLPAGDDEHPTAGPAAFEEEYAAHDEPEPPPDDVAADEADEPGEQEPEPRSSDVRRRRPATVRPAGGATPPRARNGERTLPRAYVAKRRPPGSASTPTPTEHPALEWDDANDEALGSRPSALGEDEAESRAMEASDIETRELETRESGEPRAESREPEAESREPSARPPRDPLPPPRPRSTAAPGPLSGEVPVRVATPPHALPPIEVEPRAATPSSNAPVRPTPRDTNASPARESSTLEQRLRHPLALVLIAIIIALVVFLIVGR